MNFAFVSSIPKLDYSCENTYVRKRGWYRIQPEDHAFVSFRKVRGLMLQNKSMS